MRKFCKKHSISFDRIPYNKKDVPSKECLLFFNVDEQLTFERIGMIFDVTKHTVYNWFKKYDISAIDNGTRSTVGKPSPFKKDIPDFECLEYFNHINVL